MRPMGDARTDRSAQTGFTFSNSETSVGKVLDTRRKICQLPLQQQLSPVVKLFIAVCVFPITPLYLPHTMSPSAATFFCVQ